jgi:hypothetical protein
MQREKPDGGDFDGDVSTPGPGVGTPESCSYGSDKVGVHIG